MDRGFNCRCGVVDDLVIHVGRKERFRTLHRLVDRLGSLELVGAGQEVDGHRAARLAIQTPEGVIVLRAELGAPDVFDPDYLAGRTLAHDDVLELLSRDQAARSADGIGEQLVLRRRRGANFAGGGLEILLLHGRNDVRRGQAELGQLIGLEPDPHAIVGPAEKIHLRDPRDPQQLVAQVDAAVVDEEIGVVGVFGRDTAR